MRAAKRLHAHRAGGGGEGDEAGLERRQPETDLHQQRQQERQRADAEPEQEAADHAGAQRREFQQREIQHRRGGAAGVQHVERHRNRADADQRGDDRPGQQIEAGDRQPEGDAGEANAGQHQPDEVEAFGMVALDRIDVALRQHDADEPDRNVDQKDPVPGEIGGDEAAQGRPDHRADQRRHRHPRHRADQRALVDRAQQHEAADRRHHRAAQPLQDAGADEVGDRRRQRAADRADHEHRDRHAKTRCGRRTGRRSSPTPE